MRYIDADKSSVDMWHSAAENVTRTMCKQSIASRSQPRLLSKLQCCLPDLFLLCLPRSVHTAYRHRLTRIPSLVTDLECQTEARIIADDCAREEKVASYSTTPTPSLYQFLQAQIVQPYIRAFPVRGFPRTQFSICRSQCDSCIR